MNTSPPSTPDWSLRWGRLAAAAGVRPSERLTLALSGGADSVLLLHLVAAARPRPSVQAVHVAHGLRPEAADEQAFCERLCHALGVPLVVVPIELDPRGPSLEARAREARYRALCRAARASGHTTILTGHHADDALETVLMRWLRGAHLGGVGGLRSRVRVPVGRGFDDATAPPAPGAAPIEPRVHEPIEPRAQGAQIEPRAQGAQIEPRAQGAQIEIVRPLVTLRREEVRRLLSDRGLVWCEDASNRDPRFTRTRVRHGLLPAVERLCGAAGVDHLRSFARAVDALESELAASTAHLGWRTPAYAVASRGSGEAHLGGTLPRAELMRLPRALRRRALWRLLCEATGEAPGRHLLGLLLDDVGAGRCTRHTLPGRWTLCLRSDELQLVPPAGAIGVGPQPLASGARQLALPFPPATGGRTPRAGDLTPFGDAQRPRIALTLPGIATLPDGRRISAERVDAPAAAPVPLDRTEVELDAEGLPAELQIRWPLPGDRFRGLGAPGSKNLRRFLADAGVPREERARVPLVCAGGEILWVVGVRPAERRRVGSSTRTRVRLCVHEAAWDGSVRPPATPHQGSTWNDPARAAALAAGAHGRAPA